MRFCWILIFFVLAQASKAQSPTEAAKFFLKLKPADVPAEGLLSGRSAVLYTPEISQNDINKIQQAFVQTGVDVVTYAPMEAVLAGPDVRNVFNTRFTKRAIRFIIFVRKEANEYQFWFLPFNPKNIWTKLQHAAWFVHGPKLQDVLVSVFRSLVSTQKRLNFLVNDFPEKEVIKSLFDNTRNENMISNLKVFKVAIPLMGDKQSDAELTQYLTANYHGKYELVADTISEKELALKGFRYVMRYVHAPGGIAKQIMGYEVSASESAPASVTWNNGTMQLKTIPAGETVYKFYFKDLEDRNLYLGTKWDADITWQDAMRNEIEAYRNSGRLN